MTTSPFGGKRTHVAAIIYRIGKEVSITRPDQTATENQYGKVSDGDRTYSQVTTEHARRIYAQEGNEPQQQIVSGGRLSQETPRIAFKNDTQAQEGDRVTFPGGNTYELDEQVPKDTHIEYRATKLQE